MELFDCIVVGGGPGGLLSAVYLARFKRKVLILDSGTSRAKLIPLSHNYPGTVEGISGKKIISQLKAQVKKYKIKILKKEVIQIKFLNKIFILFTHHQVFHAKSIILATGFVDVDFDIPKLDFYIKQGHIRHCLVCDGYEVQNKNIAVLGQGKKAMENIHGLLQYTRKITLLTLGEKSNLFKKDKILLNHKKIKVIDGQFDRIKIQHEKIHIYLRNNQLLVFDTAYLAFGIKTHLKFLDGLNIKLTKDKQIKVNKGQATSHPGIYAVGDVCNQLKQMVNAFGNAAIAAQSIHMKFLDQN